MNELLELAIGAHGGKERWNRTKSITVTFNFYGGLLDLKGYPGHRQLTAQLDTKEPRVTFHLPCLPVEAALGTVVLNGRS